MARGTSTGNYYTVAKTYSGATAFSVSMWIYYSTDADQTMAGLWEDSGGVQQWLLAKNSSNQLGGIIFDNSARVAVGGTITKNAWQHVAFTFASSDLVRAFINGSQVATSAVGGGGLATRTASFGVGARQAGNGAFAGSVAEMAIWTSRLTAAQIDSLSKGFSPPKVLKPDFYAPIIREMIDVTNKYAVTTVGTPTAESHPRIYK
jgi:hypothetical protein